MRLFHWLGVACVAVAALVLSFVAGVWCVKTADRPRAEVVATEAKPTVQRVTTQTTTKPDYRDEEKRSVKPPTPIRVANDPPKAEPVGVTPLPQVIQLPQLPRVGEPVAPVQAFELPAAPLPVPSMQPAAKKNDPIPLFPTTGVTPIGAPTVVPIPDSPRQPVAWTPPVEYVSKPEVEFDYALEKKGKSGVKSVTLFVRDPDGPKLDHPPNPTKNGWAPTVAWQAIQTVDLTGEGPPKLRFKMPKDGRYEFRIGLTSGSGKASGPTESDRADVVVVFDTTPPLIVGFEAEVGGGSPGTVRLSGQVKDANADPSKPPTVEYRAASGGEWQLAKVAGATWAVPEDAPAEVALRITVTDLAGNTATKTIEKLNPDTVIPTGKLTRVRVVVRQEEKQPEEKPKVLIPPIEEKK